MSRAVQGAFATPADASTPAGAGVVVPYPSVPAADEVVWRDEAGEVAGTLMRWGIRHQLQRWIPRSTLLDLWREVCGYRPPTGTRACWEGGRVWLDEVIDRVEAQNWQRRRKDTYIACAAAYAGSCLEGHPPLTTATQDKVAELIGKCDRHVRRIMAWLEQQGLLGQVLRGTRTKKVDVPAGETDQEREARLAAEAAELAARRERIAAAKACQQAALAHARAELDAVRAGAPVPPAPDGFEEFRRPATTVDQDLPTDEAARLAAMLVLRLASVYELRVPADPEPVPPAASKPVVVDLRAERDRRRPNTPPTEVDPAESHTAPEPPPAARLSLVPAPTCADTENVLPNGSVKKDLSTPDDAGVVDKDQNRGASRRSDDESCPVIDFPGRKQSTDHRSRAQRAAARLLGRTQHPQASSDNRLPQRLTWGVTVAWLAARIRPYVDADWADAELVWQITTRGGRYSHLPVHVHDRRALITASLAEANPVIRPEVRAAVAAIEADNDAAAAARQRQITWQDNAPRRRELARGRARQAAIDACGHCDEYGWTLLDGAGPEVRCDHPTDPPPTRTGPRPVPDHGGPVGAAARAAIAAQLAEQRAAREAAAAARDKQRRQLLEQARAEPAPLTDPAAGDGQALVDRVLAASADLGGRTPEERHQLAVDRARAEPGRHHHI